MLNNMPETVNPITALFSARNDIISSSVCLKCGQSNDVISLLDDAFYRLNQLQGWFIKKYPSQTPQQ